MYTVHWCLCCLHSKPILRISDLFILTLSQTEPVFDPQRGQYLVLHLHHQLHLHAVAVTTDQIVLLREVKCSVYRDGFRNYFVWVKGRNVHCKIIIIA